MPDNGHAINNKNQTVIPEAAYLEDGGEWSSPLWDDGWEGEFGTFGDVHLCVATKKWASGTVDILVAHDPYNQDGISTAYAYRHSAGEAPPLTIHGPANLVVTTVINRWEPPGAE